MPTRMPIAAVIQIDAAVVSPRTVRPSLKITPAPRKPMPVMMPCAMRVGIGADGVDRDMRHPVVLVDRDQHQQRGGHAHQRMRAKAGGTPAQGALQPDQPPINTAAPMRATTINISWLIGAGYLCWVPA